MYYLSTDPVLPYRSYTSWAYPETFLVIDLGGEVVLSAVWGYRQHGAPAFVFSAGETPFPPYAASWVVNDSKAWPSSAWHGFNLTGGPQAKFLVVQAGAPVGLRCHLALLREGCR